MRFQLLLFLLLACYSFGQDIDSLDKTNKDSLSVLSVEIPLTIGPLNNLISDSIFRFPDDIGCIIPLPPMQPLIFPDFTCSFILYSPYTEEGALNCIKRKDITLLFPGGFNGSPDLDSDEAKNFSKKYNVKLFSQGCLRFEGDNQEGYNRLIFAYLDQLYGNAWRKELPEIPVGMERPVSEVSHREITQQKKKEKNPDKPKVTLPKKASFPFLHVIGTLLIIGGIFAFKQKMKTTK